MRTSSTLLSRSLRKASLVMVAAFMATMAVVVSGSPAVAACPREENYYWISNQGQVHYRVGPGYQNYNGTPNNATVTLTATVGGSVSYSVSTTLTVKGDIIVAGVEGSLGINVSTSLYASVTNTIALTARPYTNVYGDYGVWRQKTKGMYEIIYQSCNSSSAWTTAWMPARVGWNTWGG